MTYRLRTTALLSKFAVLTLVKTMQKNWLMSESQFSLLEVPSRDLQWISGPRWNTTSLYQHSMSASLWTISPWPPITQTECYTSQQLERLYSKGRLAPLARQRQPHLCEFQASLVYIVSPRPASVMSWDPVSKIKIKSK